MTKTNTATSPSNHSVTSSTAMGTPKASASLNANKSMRTASKAVLPEPEPDRILLPGQPNFDKCDNKVISARYTALTFLPVAISEQFRRFANMYFVIVGFIMAIGYYTPLFESAISPWTTLGPLAVVLTISLIVEGNADWKRHRNDAETNNAPCVILRRTDELEAEAKELDGPKKSTTKAAKKHKTPRVERDPHFMRGRDCSVPLDATHTVKVSYQRLARQDIRQGHFVLVKNREMVPADMLLLASSNDHGSAYIETSSIDGETNLKLRTCPRIPKKLLKAWRGAGMRSNLEGISEVGGPIVGDDDDDDDDDDEEEGGGDDDNDHDDSHHSFETIDSATKRLARLSYLGYPAAKSVYEHPEYKRLAELAQQESQQGGANDRQNHWESESSENFANRVFGAFSKNLSAGLDTMRRPSSLVHRPMPGDENRFIAALTTEPPNPSVHTFSGKLTLPPLHAELIQKGVFIPPEGRTFLDVSLDAENVLLRGAVLRNTEWAIGVAFFTGTDTKLVQNSVKTPSKFSQLDRLMNFTVVAILCIMFCCIVYLASQATVTNRENFHLLWYVGFNHNTSEPWPYLPDLPPPNWRNYQQNWVQLFFLYVTLLNNFVPLSLYVTVELITFCMLVFVYVDVDMYDPTTNTRAVARSTIVTDLGRIQYIFSDKTGTLTQNVMRFKRCSVDGMAFGAPIEKSRPKDETNADEEEEPSKFYPLRQLLVGQFKRPQGLEGLGGLHDAETAGQTLTFNAEMFLRVMSLCHTVVVEKDIDQTGGKISSGESQRSNNSTKKMSLFGRKRANTGDSIKSNKSNKSNHSPMPALAIENSPGMELQYDNRTRMISEVSLPPDGKESLQGPDGAPAGYAYQAESPDEGALVSAASKTYNFQVVSRDSSGIRIRVNYPSHLQVERVVKGLKQGNLTLKRLAAESAAELESEPLDVTQSFVDTAMLDEPREETWTILAVNKFDSDRKRMSILLRSPPELGNLPILFCKGADSSMLDPEICQSSSLLTKEGSQRDGAALTSVSESEDDEQNGNDKKIDEDEWEMAQVLGLQAHLGDFASEGLRTLVLGMRVLSEDECNKWLDEYNAAATALKDRAELLTKVATTIERKIHIVGATAIEDRLQTNVPQTISTLGKAGIKLWVLTGDKRETAVEIGYSTHVLTPKMHITEVADNGKKHVRTQMAMEFIRLVKLGKLVEYQQAQLEDIKKSAWSKFWQAFMIAFGRMWRGYIRARTLCMAFFYEAIGWRSRAVSNREWVQIDKLAEKRRIQDIDKRRLVRAHADELIRKWIDTEEGGGRKAKQKDGDDPEDMEDLSLTSEETPQVFNRASSAKSLLRDLRDSGKLSEPKLRELSLAQLTVHQANGPEPLVDEDTLSMDSFFPGEANNATSDFDSRKRTILERLFAIDREVRKGRLRKHMKKARLAELSESKSERQFFSKASEGPRALVIEGAALKHLLGDDRCEAMLFSVAKNCDAVIACRVSPKQKALLLNLVRNNVKPEPITLAIGDGANDVGMIQEAHVGVGISGKEGKQAVNASDFAISQFRFLEDLILVHGRWDFYRLSTVVLFSFYKNAILAGILICYSGRVLYSGTPLFDEWLIAMFNFVAGMPIVILGLFDRFLSKEYVKAHPEVYKSTRENELITKRTLLRWVVLVFVHIFSLYYFTVPQQAHGGGMTSAFQGLMGNKNKDPYAPGDGEGGDLKSVGTVTFTCLIILLAYKVLYESKALIHGYWPAFTCKKGVGEGFWSRTAYTWHGVIFFSLAFYLFAINVYAALGRSGPSSFSQFTMVAYHVLATRSLDWMLFIFVPVSAIGFDICGKVFANMFFPTQSQIHNEIEAKMRSDRRKNRALHPRHGSSYVMKEDLPSPVGTGLNEP